MSSLRIILLITALGLVVVLGIYLVNPSGTASADPRARLLGYVLYLVPSESNAPTLRTGELAVVSTFAYASDEIQRGDMVAFFPVHSKLPHLKRVVAVAGDTIEVAGGRVILNGVVLEEPYVAPENARRASRTVAYTVPDQSLFVLGDNRDQSEDSRSYGFVANDAVIGKVAWDGDN